MLNNEKIILMTKLSLYEQKNQKKEISTGKYFKSDYMLLKMLSSFICATVGYLLCLILWFMYKSDRVFASMTTTGSFTVFVVVIVLLYIILTSSQLTSSISEKSERTLKNIMVI